MTTSATRVAASPLTISGVGVMSGKPVEVRVFSAGEGHGIVFYPDNAQPIPARLESVVRMERGVTLANGEGQSISIVEHFLSAATMAGLRDLRVEVSAPEMPILDGSAQNWIKAFARHFDIALPQPAITLKHAVFYRHNEEIALYALPDTHFRMTYCVNFRHPDLKSRWTRWDSRSDNPALISTACTFGYINELPALHTRGLALGASLENSLGLLEKGGYSRKLRHENEPIYHKMLDLIGDLSLTGLNPFSLKAHVFAINAGHSSHIPFAAKLLTAI